MKRDTLLIIDSSEDNADLYYRTGFLVPDPVVFIEHGGERVLVLSDLELGRGKREARVDSVLSLSEYKRRLSTREQKRAGLIGIVNLILKERRIRKVVVPGRFPIRYADELRKLGYRVDYKREEPFFQERLRKTPEEVGFIRDSLRKTARVMRLAIRMIASSEIKRGRLFFNGAPLTSERVRGEINAELSRMGFTASHTIVACGVQSSMPHHRGEGPLFARQPIVIDVFPRSQKNGYFGDMTRTVVKGEPSKELDEMYKAVLDGQRLGMSLIKDGVKAKEVHGAIVE
ncbi:MAG TPA: M24 family metallopeptidase, partial [Thermodesulfobacteriota bacterium]|nr:M24 family metallopeptidase [Thermodesulfobacteriota bacterium]